MSGPWLPLIVFLAEMFVVTLSTIRIIFLSRGRKGAAALLGFFEITLWLFAMAQIMQNLCDIGCYLGFAAGFTIGNFLGVWIENCLGLGTVLVRIITAKNAAPLVASLQAHEFGITYLDGHGARGPVKIVFSVIPRKELSRALAVIGHFDPKAFYAVDEIQSVGPSFFSAGKLGEMSAAATPGMVMVAARNSTEPQPQTQCAQAAV